MQTMSNTQAANSIEQVTEVRELTSAELDATNGGFLGLIIGVISLGVAVVATNPGKKIGAKVYEALH